MIVSVILTCDHVIGRPAHHTSASLHVFSLVMMVMGVEEGEVMNGAMTDALNSSYIKFECL